MALLEAAACGLPAVATGVAGTREAVVHGETGWLARQGDPKALAEAMTILMRTKENDRIAMGERARQRVMDCFSLESALNRWEALYSDLLQRNRKPGRWARTP